jgi:hypothetical protein
LQTEEEKRETERGVLIYPACVIEVPMRVRIGLACTGTLAERFNSPQGEETIAWIVHNAPQEQKRGVSWHSQEMLLVIWLEFVAKNRKEVLVATKRFRDQLAEQHIEVTQLPILPPNTREAIGLARHLLTVG